LEDIESRGEAVPDPGNILIGSVLVTRWVLSCPFSRVRM